MFHLFVDGLGSNRWAPPEEAWRAFLAFGMLVDNATRMELVRSMKPEGRTVEGLCAHADKLRPYIDMFDPEGIEEQ